MLNTQLFNSRVFNSGTRYSTVSIPNLLQYWDYNFWNNIFRVISLTDLDDLGTLNFNTWDIAMWHWEWLSSYYFKRKDITVKWVLSADTVSELENRINALKANVLQSWQQLKFLRRSWQLVQTTASCTSLRFDRQYYHITFVPVEIVFTTLEPFFYSVATNEVNRIDQTSNLSTTINVNTGNYEAEPQILINFESTGITSVTSVEVDIAGTAITISETISNSDQIIIDCKEKEVTINGTGWVDYTGTFPTLPQGTSSFDVTINGTREVDIYVIRPDTYV